MNLFEINSFIFSFTSWSLFNLMWNLEYLLVLSNFIFLFGIFGIILNRRNFLVSMLFIEVMYTGIFMYFIVASLFLNLPAGQVYALVILVSAACESAIGLGILLILFRYDNSINFEDFTELRG